MCGAFGTAHHPWENFQHLFGFGCTDIVKQFCTVLYHIWSASAAVAVGIVDSGFGDYMFAKIVYPYIHQFCCIKSTSAKVRGGGSVTGGSFETELNNQICKGGNIKYMVGCVRVPGNSNVGVVKHAFPGHKSLAAS